MSPLRTVEGRSVSRRYCVSECGSSVANGHREAQTLVGRQGTNLDACARAIDHPVLDHEKNYCSSRKWRPSAVQDRQILHSRISPGPDRVLRILDERFEADRR